MLVFLCVILTTISLITYIVFYISNKEVTYIYEKDNTEEKEIKQIIEYKANQTIMVKMTKDYGQIVAMDINDYLRGVLASEMPASYDIEALKAQAIVARTYTYKKMEDGAESGEADVCDDYNHCQAFYTKEKIMEIWTNKGYDEELRNEYWDKINTAVVETQNMVITYEGEYIKAFFHASSPIATENVDQIWGNIYYPYLVSVANVESEEYANRESCVVISFTQIEEYITENINEDFCMDYTGDNIYIYDYTTSGRVNNVDFCGVIISSEVLRVAFGLKSTQFEINIVNEDSVEFNVTGYGHGVGLSQVGSDYLAKEGMEYEEIIKYYYTGVEVIKLDS